MASQSISSIGIFLTYFLGKVLVVLTVEVPTYVMFVAELIQFILRFDVVWYFQISENKNIKSHSVSLFVFIKREVV